MGPVAQETGDSVGVTAAIAGAWTNEQLLKSHQELTKALSFILVRTRKGPVLSRQDLIDIAEDGLRKADEIMGFKDEEVAGG